MRGEAFEPAESRHAPLRREPNEREQHRADRCAVARVTVERHDHQHTVREHREQRAATTGAQVMPVIATFLPNFQGWRVKFYPVWDNYPGTDMVAATRRMNAFIEERVREAPAEYFWTHKRFKTRPEGEPSL